MVAWLNMRCHMVSSLYVAHSCSEKLHYLGNYLLVQSNYIEVKLFNIITKGDKTCSESTSQATKRAEGDNTCRNAGTFCRRRQNVSGRQQTLSFTDFTVSSLTCQPFPEGICDITLAEMYLRGVRTQCACSPCHTSGSTLYGPRRPSFGT